MAVFFSLPGLVASASAAGTPITLFEINQQRATVKQSLQLSQDEQQKVASIEKSLNDSNSNGAISDQARIKLQQQQQVLDQLQAEENQEDNSQSDDFLQSQNAIIATEIDRQQELQQVQAQIEIQRQNVEQLYQSVQAQTASNIESPLLENATAQYQVQLGRLNQLEAIKENLAVEAGQAQMQESFNQTQSYANAKKSDQDLQSQYAEAQKVYRQLEQSYQLALSQEDANRKKAADLADELQPEKQRQIAADDAYARESEKLSQMLTSFSEQ